MQKIVSINCSSIGGGGGSDSGSRSGSSSRCSGVHCGDGTLYAATLN